MPIRSQLTSKWDRILHDGRSFFVLPHHLHVAQNVGGDGVDNNQDGVPDGVGVGLPFRRQPAVVIRGNGYLFKQSWSQHGHIPVTAIIHPGSCGGNCSRSEVRLLGNSAFEAVHDWTHCAYENGACACNGKVRYGDTSSDRWTIPRDASGIVSCDNSVFGEPIFGVRKTCQCSLLGEVGVLWRDLLVTAAPGHSVLDIKLSLRVAPYSTQSSAMSMTETTLFDAFLAPDPPINLRVHSYGNLGFRLEFDPAHIARAKPLSGFIVEVDQCTVSETSCARISDASYPTTYSLSKSLGTEYSTGGGHVEEVLIEYTSGLGGSPSYINMTFTPYLTISADDSILLNFGYPGIIFRNFKAECEIQGPDASKLSLFVDPVLSRVKLTVKAGNSLLRGHSVTLSIPESCSFVLPGGPDWNYTGIYGEDGQPAHLPAVVLAPILGAAGSARFDNCKGAQSCLPTGQKMVLPSIQDGSSMDTSWSGSLQYGGIGSAVSGHNGKPIGQSPVQGTGASGTLFSDSDEGCRSGQGSINPCVLSIGQDWTVTVSATYIKDASTGRVTSAKLKFARNKVLQKGDKLILPFSTRTLSSCNGTVANTSSIFICKPRMEINVSNAPLSANIHTDWSLEWNVTSTKKQLTIYVGSAVNKNAEVCINIDGFIADQPISDDTLSENLVSQVLRGNKTTVIFSNSFKKASYTSSEGNPLENYEQAGTNYLSADGIFQFRIYSYNGRFRSVASQTLVQNRAINRPAQPAYFPQMSQTSVGADFEFTLLQENQRSLPTLGSARPNPATPGAPTRIGISFTPRHAVDQGQTLSVKLPGFSGVGHQIIDNSRELLLLANEYEVLGNSSQCSCTGGVVSTPRNVYSVRRAASGSGSCNGTSSSPNASLPWCACPDCQCTLAGIPLTPPAIYNSTGNCTLCDCSATGTPLYTALEYIASGNCSSCACTADGISTYNTSQACACSCAPKPCVCSCSLFRGCSCGCDIAQEFWCGCRQSQPHPLVSKATWSGHEQSLILTVAKGKKFEQSLQHTIWISSSTGLKYPANGIVPLGADGISPGGIVTLNRFRIDWVSSFPTSLQPRLGFIVQFSTDLFWKTNIQVFSFWCLCVKLVRMYACIYQRVHAYSSVCVPVCCFSRALLMPCLACCARMIWNDRRCFSRTIWMEVSLLSLQSLGSLSP